MTADEYSVCTQMECDRTMSSACAVCGIILCRMSRCEQMYIPLARMNDDAHLSHAPRTADVLHMLVYTRLYDARCVASSFCLLTDSDLCGRRHQVKGHDTSWHSTHQHHCITSTCACASHAGFLLVSNATCSWVWVCACACCMHVCVCVCVSTVCFCALHHHKHVLAAAVCVLRLSCSSVHVLAVLLLLLLLSICVACACLHVHVHELLLLLLLLRGAQFHSPFALLCSP